MKSKKYQKLRLDGDIQIVNIVSDSIIMQRHFADGKQIPLIIIDTSEIPQIEQSIALHNGINSGEAAITWGKTPDSKYIFLQIQSLSPVEITYMIAFEPYKHCGLIDILLNAHLLYIQAGKDGDRLSHNLNKPKLLIEIPKSSFEKELTKITHKAKMNRFKNLNVKKHDLEKLVSSFDDEWGSFINKRFK